MCVCVFAYWAVSVTSKGRRGQCSTIGVCVCLVPGDKEPSLISVICFPRWQGQSKRGAWWKGSSCRVTLFLPCNTHYDAVSRDPSSHRWYWGFSGIRSQRRRASWSESDVDPCCSLMSLTREVQWGAEKLTQEGDISTSTGAITLTPAAFKHNFTSQLKYVFSNMLKWFFNGSLEFRPCHTKNPGSRVSRLSTVSEGGSHHERGLQGGGSFCVMGRIMSAVLFYLENSPNGLMPIKSLVFTGVTIIKSDLPIIFLIFLLILSPRSACRALTLRGGTRSC